MEFLAWGYLTGLVLGGAVAYTAYIRLREDLYAEKRMYEKMQYDLEMLMATIKE